ncbi:MAG: GAF domain-containing protein [Chloroflexi bacterium]|nr:GAF domain-containing protein [Chloroflexota bacterium]
MKNNNPSKSERAEFIVAGKAPFKDRLVPVLATAVQSLDGTAGVIALWKSDRERFVTEATYGLDSMIARKLRPMLEKAIPDLGAGRNGFGRISRIAQGLRNPVGGHQVFDPVIAAPLFADDKTIGLMYILRPSSAKQFTASDRRVLSAFAGQAVMSLENVRLASQLAEEHHKTESIVEHSADGIMTIDSKLRILTFNAGMERLTGWKRSEAIGDYCFRVLNLVDNQGRELCRRKCPIARGVSGVYYQRGAITGKDSQKVDVSMSYSLPSPRQPSTTVVNVRDIGTLRQIDNVRSMLLAGVSHELQTPISIIKAYASTLARPDAEWSPQTIRDKLQAIEEESDRLSKLVAKLLYTSQLEARSLPLNMMSVNLPGEVVKVVRRLARNTEIHKFESDFPPDFPGILADPEKIEEVLTNLVDNAVKFSPRGGTINITGKVLDNDIQVTIADEGIGISLQDREKLFERFYRVADSSRKSTPGMGLGLYICKTILEAHGGRIWTEGERGEGSRFIFTLPIPLPEESTVLDSRSASGGRRISGWGWES